VRATDPSNDLTTPPQQAQPKHPQWKNRTDRPLPHTPLV